MSFSSVKEIFIPKSKIFYTLFEEVAFTANNMSKLLLEFLGEENAGKRSILLKKIEEEEHKNDHTTHALLISLGKYFITPFDREDIYYLAKALGDISDNIYASAKKIVVYKIQPFR